MVQDTIGDHLCHWAVRRPGHVTGPTNHELNYLICLLKGIAQLFIFLLFFLEDSDPSAIFDIRHVL